MTLKEIWAPLIQAALDEYLSKKSATEPVAVPAAPLKPLVVRHAERAGLAFPPEGYEHFKFVDFLELFPSVVKAHRRPGQDALVVRAQDADLVDRLVLEEQNRPSAKREHVNFRGDVFNAFTKILPPERSHWYSRVEDKFFEDDSVINDKLLVQVPTLTLEDALDERRDFACTVKDVDQQELLRRALDESRGPLGAFGKAIKEGRLEGQWHLFRVDRVTRRIKDWADSVGLEVNPAWESPTRRAQPESDTVTARETNAFLAGLMKLGPEDAKRVMIPLDIVLKLIRHD